MPLIAYDQHVLDLRAGLNATGHITHANDTKDMVTFHHNGGIFTAQQILDIWKTREASAHFDVDKNGTIAQFANVNDYAWACANTEGNRRSVSIEMSNSTGAPAWEVAIDTWQKGARLAGFLFAKGYVKGQPTKDTVVFHHHWYATACAGPYMDKAYGELLDATQKAYAYFKGTPTPTPTPTPAKLTVDGYFGPASIRRLQQVMGTTVDGVITPGGSQVVKALQTFLNAKGAKDENGHQLVVDGICYLDNTSKATPKQHTVAALERYLHTTVDAFLSSPSSCVKALQTALNKAKTGSKEF